MKLGLIYNPKDNKLQPTSYSQSYRSQFLALQRYWPDEVVHITENCSADDIEADVIIFYDVHSSHHIKIDNIAKHKAVKYEYFNDPHQRPVKGHYPNGVYVHKLGAEERVKRALERGVDFIICPFTNMYYQYIAPLLNGQADKMRVWFPVVPDEELFTDRTIPLLQRKQSVLANGAIVETKYTSGYVFRAWAYKQPYVEFVPHAEIGKNDIVRAPSGMEYPNFLARYAGSLALTDDHIVPKYLEIPLAGCVCFASWHQDYINMGFEDGENCIFVDRRNLESVVRDFLNNVKDYQQIADAGRELIESKWTSKCFCEFIYDHSCRQIAGNEAGVSAPCEIGH